jgi:DNA-binding transcriptional MerR regulator
MQMSPKQLFTRDVIALFEGLTDSTLRYWLRQGKVKPERLSRWNYVWRDADILTIQSLLEGKRA